MYWLLAPSVLVKYYYPSTFGVVMSLLYPMFNLIGLVLVLFAIETVIQINRELWNESLPHEYHWLVLAYNLLFPVIQVPAVTLTANVVWSSTQFLLRSLSPHISKFLDRKSQQAVVTFTATYLQQKSQSLVRYFKILKG